MCSMRTIKVLAATCSRGYANLIIHLKQSDVVVGLPDESIAERLDREEPGWKISGKYVGYDSF